MRDTRSNQRNVISRLDSLIAGGLVISLLLLYLSTRLQVHNQCVDCINYVASIKRGELSHLFHGAHLIYLWLLSGIYKSLMTFMSEVDVYVTAQVFNSLMASFAVCVFYLLARNFRQGRWLSLSLSLVLAFSYNYWLFAIDAEVHAPAIFFYLLTLLVAFRLPVSAHGWKFVGLGVLTALAILFHTFCGLMGLVIIALILLQRDDQAYSPIRIDSKKICRVLLYSITTALCVMIPYLFVTTQVLHLRTASEIVSWIFNFRETVGYRNRVALPLNSTLFLSFTGVIRAFLGSIVWITAPGLGEMLLQMFPEKCAGEELYLVRNLTPTLAFVITTFGAACGGLLATLAAMSIRGLINAFKRISRAVIALAIWLILYAVLIMYFAPGSYEHWAIYWLPIFFLAVGLGLSQITQQKGKRHTFVQLFVIVLVLSLFVANFGNVLLQTRADNDIYLHRLDWYQTNAKGEDLIISAGGYKWTGYMDYYLLAKVETLDKLFRSMDYTSVWEDMQAKIRLTQSKGSRVFVMEDVFEPELCQARYGDWDLMLYDTFSHDIMPRLDCFEHDDISICEVVR